MNDKGKNLILPLLNHRFKGYFHIGMAGFVFLFLLVVSVAAFPTEPETLILSVPMMLIAVYVGLLWILLCCKKLHIREDGLQVVLFGRCIQTIPADRLQMVCMVTRKERQGKRHTYRLQRRLAISCKTMEQLQEPLLESVTWYLVRRMKYRLPIDGVWADCYPELVAGLRQFYPSLKWEQVSTVSLTPKVIRDDDPCYFLRNPGDRENVGYLLLAILIAFGVFVYLALREGAIILCLQILLVGLVFAGIILLIEGNDRALVRFLPDGISMKENGMTHFYPAEQLRTAVVYTELSYYDGKRQMIVFSTLSAEEIAQKQARRMKRGAYGENMILQCKKIPNWGTRLVYRYSRNVAWFSMFYCKKTNYILHSQAREQALRELYPKMQWLYMTDEFEVIV